MLPLTTAPEITPKPIPYPDPTSLASTSTKEAYNQCSYVTAKSLSLLSSKYSFLYQGVQLASLQPRGSDGPGAFFFKKMGWVFLLTSIFQEPLRCIAGVVGGTAGAVATGAVGIVHAGQQALESYEEAQLVRRHITKTFVDSMLEILQKVESEIQSYPEIKQLRENPKDLISMAALGVAFLSRNTEGKCLATDCGFINEAILSNQPDICMKYFDLLCEMKNGLNFMNLSKDDEHAWSYLMDAYHNLNKDKVDLYSNFEIENLKYVEEQCELLCQLFIKDPIFIELWNQK